MRTKHNDTVEVHVCTKCNFVYESPVRLLETPCHACKGNNMRYTNKKQIFEHARVVVSKRVTDLLTESEVARMHERAEWVMDEFGSEWLVTA